MKHLVLTLCVAVSLPAAAEETAAARTTPPSGVPRVRTPDLAELGRADQSADPALLERVAARIGAARLLRAAQRARAPERLAALHGLALLDDAASVLPELARLVGDPDAQVAARAAESMQQIAERARRAVVVVEDLPPDVPARAIDELLVQAARSDLTEAVRVAAIEAAATLATQPVRRPALEKLISDPLPAVRRAAAEALADAPGGEIPLEAALTRDSDATVAAAAAAALCRDVPAVAGRSAAEARAARLLPPARARLRTLALDETLAVADRYDLLACLRVFAAPEDRAALDQVAKRPLESLKRRARSLGGR